jgi:hypothetical protein
MVMEQYHWFCFSFQGQDRLGNQVIACSYAGYTVKEPCFTKGEIYRQRNFAGTPNGVLLSATYLGYMTKEEFDNA